MTATIIAGANNAEKRVLSTVFKEMVHENTLLPWMGTTTNMPIQIIEQGSKKGDVIVVPFLNALDNDGVFGSQQLEGSGETQDFQDDVLTVDLFRFAGKLEDVQMSEQRAPFQVFQEMRPALVTRGAEHLRDHIIDALGDNSEGRVRNRYLYGKTDDNWNSTHATALANIDAANDKMSLKIVRLAKLKAQLGGITAGVAKNNKLRPFKMMMDNGALSNVWVFLLHPTAADHLRDDPLFINLNLNKNGAAIPKLVDGSRYMGNYQGVMLYELDELDRLADGSQPARKPQRYTRTDLTTADADSAAVVHNLFLGAQAAAVGIAMRPRFSSEESDHGRIIEIGVTEIRDEIKLVYNSVDNGVVSVFTSGVLS